MLFSLQQIEKWKTERVSGKTPAIAYGRHEFSQHLHLLEQEFIGKPRLCFATAELIVRIRRELELNKALETFNYLMEEELDFLCSKLNSRWLVSIADTIADHGSENEQLGAMISVVLVNAIKLTETERYFATDSTPDESRLKEVGGGQPPLPLWDGMSSYWVSCGDMPSSLFRRCRQTLQHSPISLTIFETLLARIQTHPNLLSRLARYNPCFWE